ncbi:DUF2634 domain-containing protein [Metabacillus fastidiosus]|uniref:DUF2634 domain-containing protein n=1 Tax=Metabacillus fastidiosus TaxID=1458 RepID=A0ABU6NRY1_9BACI|nr:DUF2634 domain-containing protein [Metabacillus fastidiosus]
MSLLPNNDSETLDEYLIRQTEESNEPSLTYRLNFQSGKVSGMIDGKEAIRQFIVKSIITNRSKYMIYTDNYGCELPSLIGQDVTKDYIDSEIPRMVTEALIYDDRITAVRDVQAEQKGDAVFILVTVDSIYGEIVEEVVI